MTLSSWASDSRPSVTTRPAGAADRSAWAARPTPSPPTARAWSDAAASREYGSTASRILRRALGEAAALGRRPVDGLIGELDRLRLGDCADGDGGARAHTARTAARRRRDAAVGAAATGPAIGQPRRHMLDDPASSVATSGAMPGDGGNAVGSSAGSLSMTVSRVSIVVPCLA